MSWVVPCQSWTAGTSQIELRPDCTCHTETNMQYITMKILDTAEKSGTCLKTGGGGVRWTPKKSVSEVLSRCPYLIRCPYPTLHFSGNALLHMPNKINSLQLKDMNAALTHTHHIVIHCAFHLFRGSIRSGAHANRVSVYIKVESRWNRD
jgi:hypothetical protein